jgi:hypothetical protein
MKVSFTHAENAKAEPRAVASSSLGMSLNLTPQSTLKQWNLRLHGPGIERDWYVSSDVWNQCIAASGRALVASCKQMTVIHT